MLKLGAREQPATTSVLSFGNPSAAMHPASLGKQVRQQPFCFVLVHTNCECAKTSEPSWCEVGVNPGQMYGARKCVSQDCVAQILAEHIPHGVNWDPAAAAAALKVKVAAATAQM